MTSTGPTALPKSSNISLESPPMLTQHVPSPTGQPKIVSKLRSGSPGYDTAIRDPGLSDVRKSTGTKDHRKSKRNNHACTQAREKRKPEVRSSSLRFRTEHEGNKRLVNEHLPLGCLGEEPERIPAVASDATSMRTGGLLSKTFDPKA